MRIRGGHRRCPECFRGCLSGSGRTPRWIAGALVIESGSFVSIARRLSSVGFRVAGDKEFVETSRLYVHEGKCCLYTADREIPNASIREILKSAGDPN
jgi:hypothetical protein